MIVVDVSQLNRLAVDLGRAGPAAIPPTRVAIAKTAHNIQATGQMFAPVDTGFLRSSIGTDIRQGGLAAEIGPTADYGHYVEYGTSRMGPHAYMGPAFDRHAHELEDALGQIAAGTLGRF